MRLFSAGNLICALLCASIAICSNNLKRPSSPLPLISWKKRLLSNYSQEYANYQDESLPSVASANLLQPKDLYSPIPKNSSLSAQAKPLLPYQPVSIDQELLLRKRKYSEKAPNLKIKENPNMTDNKQLIKTKLNHFNKSYFLLDFPHGVLSWSISDAKAKTCYNIQNKGNLLRVKVIVL